MFGNEIADALAKAAANGLARPEGAAHSCREWLSRWSGDSLSEGACASGEPGGGVLLA